MACELPMRLSPTVHPPDSIQCIRPKSAGVCCRLPSVRGWLNGWRFGRTLGGCQAATIDEAQRRQHVHLRLVVVRHRVGIAQPRFVERILGLKDIDRKRVSGP